MIPTQQDVDHWHTTTHRHLGLACAAVLDLIDCGTPTRTVSSRKPSDRDLEATHRASDPSGLFQPTLKTQGRRSPGQRSDPTGRQVVAWEAEVQAAVLALYGVVSAVDDIAGHLAPPLAPHDEHGDPIDAPREPATKVNGSGRLVVTEHPRLCRLATLDAVTWLGAVVDQVADRLRGVTDPDVGDHLLERAGTVQGLLVRLGRQVEVRPAGSVRLCACGCRRPAPPVGRGATRGACRERLSQERRAS